MAQYTFHWTIYPAVALTLFASAGVLSGLFQKATTPADFDAELKARLKKTYAVAALPDKASCYSIDPDRQHTFFYDEYKGGPFIDSALQIGSLGFREPTQERYAGRGPVIAVTSCKGTKELYLIGKDHKDSQEKIGPVTEDIISGISSTTLVTNIKENPLSGYGSVAVITTQPPPLDQKPSGP